VKDIDEQMDDLHKEINPEKIAPVSEEVAVKAPAAKEETSIKVEATPVNSSKVASITNSTAKLEVYGNKTNSTVPVSVAKVNATANSTSLDPFAELKQEKDFMNLAQKPKSVSLLQIDQQVVSDSSMLDHFQIDQSLSEESFFADVVGEESSLIETNSTHINKHGQEEKITLIKGDHQKLEFVESLVELGDDETEMPKEADVMLEDGPMDKPEDHGLAREEVAEE